MSRPLALLLALTLALGAGCAATNKQQRARVVWTPPPGDQTYRTPEEASRAYETVRMMAGDKQVRYMGAGRWQILDGERVLREIVIGGQADIEWDQ